MKCDYCLTENAVGAVACVKCGSPLSTGTSNSGTAAPKSASASVDDEFELQPEAPKSEREVQQGPPPVDTRNEADGPEASVPGKKPKKKIPEISKDYKREAQMMMAVMGGLLIVPVLAGCAGYAGIVGWGIPNMIGLSFGMLALLESTKVIEFHRSGDYTSSVEASTAAQWYIRTGYLAAVGALIVLGVGYTLWLVFAKMMSVMLPKTDVPAN